MKNSNTVLAQQLFIIKNKGNCFYTIGKAQSVLRAIKIFLTPEEHTSIWISLEHKFLGEGSLELNSIIDPIIKKYS